MELCLGRRNGRRNLVNQVKCFSRANWFEKTRAEQKCVAGKPTTGEYHVIDHNYSESSQEMDAIGAKATVSR